MAAIDQSTEEEAEEEVALHCLSVCPRCSNDFWREARGTIVHEVRTEQVAGRCAQLIQLVCGNGATEAAVTKVPTRASLSYIRSGTTATGAAVTTENTQTTTSTTTTTSSAT